MFHHLFLKQGYLNLNIPTGVHCFEVKPTTLANTKSILDLVQLNLHVGLGWFGPPRLLLEA